MKNIEMLSELQNSDQSVHDEIEIRCMKDIEMKPIDWLWPKRIARGKLTVFAGNPGLGKSQLTAWLASIVSKGGDWPDSSGSGNKGGVIIISAEDDPADIIKPRLIAAGADVSACHLLQAVKTTNSHGQQGKRCLDLTKDIEKLDALFRRIDGLSLIIIDPISAYMGDTNSHNNSEIRGMLTPLNDVAASHNVAVVVVTHLNKSSEQDMIGRVIGSIGLIAAARAGYAVIKDEQHPEIRYFLPIKNNIGNDHDGFAFQIEGVNLGNGIETSKIVWNPGTVDAHRVLYPEQPEQKTNATSTACDFLSEKLSQGPVLVKDLFEEGEAAGFSKPVLRRAQQKLGIIRKKHGMAGGWKWRLPGTEDDEVTEDNIGELTPSTS